MFEQFRSFAEYVLDYDLERSEGLLLRHLNSVYKVLSQTVPDGVKSDQVLEMEIYLRTLLRQVDSSLEEEWERMRDPDYQPLVGAGSRAMDMRPPGEAAEARDITRDAKVFTAAIRTRVFTFLRAWSTGDPGASLGALGVPNDAAGEAWTEERLRAAFDEYRAGHQRLRLDPEARNTRHTYVTPSNDGEVWRVQQMLVDPEMTNDWVAEYRGRPGEIAGGRRARHQDVAPRHPRVRGARPSGLDRRRANDTRRRSGS